MPKLTIVAHIRVHPDRVELVRGELEKLVPLTRAERGCLQYDLHRDDQDPAHFMFYETWESRELWQAHMASAHIAAYRRKVEGAVADFALYEMSRIA